MKNQTSLHQIEIAKVSNTRSLYFKIAAIKTALALFFLFLLSDFIYKTIQNINYLNRSKCFVYKFFPKVGFLFFEYFVELSILVFIGVFVATLLEKYFMRYKKFFPANPITAFIYASMLPVCACAAIPMLKTMQEKMKLRTLVTFLVAAPLLNPYIILLSVSALGVTYGILRVVASFILAVSAGYMLDFFHEKNTIKAENLNICNTSACMQNDIYLKTCSIFKSIIPYLVIGGLIAIGIDLASSKAMSLASMINNSFFGNLMVVIIGIPFYFCNGTDVLLLKPLLCSGVSVGTGIAFSLTSTAICITSILLLFKFMGKRLTFLLIGHIIAVALLLSQTINSIF